MRMICSTIWNNSSHRRQGELKVNYNRNKSNLVSSTYQYKNRQMWTTFNPFSSPKNTVNKAASQEKWSTKNRFQYPPQKTRRYDQKTQQYIFFFQESLCVEIDHYIINAFFFFFNDALTFWQSTGSIQFPLVLMILYRFTFWQGS